MRKGFIVRDRSLTSLPSKQLSIRDLMQQKNGAFHSYKSKMQQESSLLRQKKQKEGDVVKLKVNLDNALRMAVNSAVQNSRYKEESSRATHNKIYYERKFNSKQQQLNLQKIKTMNFEQQIISLQHQTEKLKATNLKLTTQNQNSEKKIKQLSQRLKQMDILKQKIQQIPPLITRIKSLQINLRKYKLQAQQYKQKTEKLQIAVEQAQKKLKETKPYQQQLQQRISYLQRVNLQLQRKMEDHHKREHQYKKQITFYKSSLGKMTSQKNKYKNQYEETIATLQIKLEDIKKLEKQIKQKSQKISSLQSRLQQKSASCQKLAQQLQSTLDYYKAVGEENQKLKKQNAQLQDFQLQVRRTLQAYQKVADETNGYIIACHSNITNLEEKNKILMDNLQEEQKRYSRLDKCLEEETNRGKTQIKQSFYAVIRQNDKLKLTNKQMQAQFHQKVLKFGQERDSMNRTIEIFQKPVPDQKHLLEAIISDQSEQILMLQGSNDQLIKIKKQFQQQIRVLENICEQNKKQIFTLRLKAADLFKAKKEVEEAKKKVQRYQQMIEQQKQSIEDLQSQATVLRDKSKILQQKNYTTDLQSKNYAFKLKQYEQIMKDLDVEFLQAKKNQNEKNAHVLTDSIDKMQSGISSLANYFSCCYCGETLTTPVTLATCGHNYCTKCKAAYSEYCYECDTGQPIQKVYNSKYLRETAAKYKFLLMVVKQAKNNLIKINAAS